MAEKQMSEETTDRPGETDPQDISYPIDGNFADVTGRTCPILYSLGIVGQKWKLPILWFLHKQEGTRYNELRRQISGITNTMLTKSLRELEAAGLVRRVEEETVPPKVEYFLTEDGKALLPTLNALYEWGERQMAKDGAGE